MACNNCGEVICEHVEVDLRRLYYLSAVMQQIATARHPTMLRDDEPYHANVVEIARNALRIADAMREE